MKKPNILDRAIMTMAPVHAAKRAAARVAQNNVIRSDDPQAVEKLQAQFVREFALWADTPVCDAERMDNFYQLQQLAFLSYLMNGDTIALLPMKH